MQQRTSRMPKNFVRYSLFPQVANVAYGPFLTFKDRSQDASLGLLLSYASPKMKSFKACSWLNLSRALFEKMRVELEKMH